MTRVAARAAVLLLVVAAIGCAGGPTGGAEADEPVSPLDSVSAWAIQLQEIDAPGAVTRLAAAKVDLLIVEPTATVAGRESFPIRPVVAQLAASRGVARPGKLVLAYLNVGQAERYRTYWDDAWTEGTFLLGDDPDGFRGNHPVAFWEPRWRTVVLEELDRLLAAGFHGVMLDWVTGFAHEPVVAAAEAAGVDPAQAMADLVAAVAARGRAARPDFVVLLNDGADLLAARPELIPAVDGVVRESIWFAGRASSDWDDPQNADAPVADPTPVVEELERLKAKGLTILALDYASTPENVAESIANACRHGFLPFPTRTPLSRLPLRHDISDK